MQSFFSVAVAGLMATSLSLRAEDPLPPKPPGGSTIPPAVAPSTPAVPGSSTPAPNAGKTSLEILTRLQEQLDLAPDQMEKIKVLLEKQREELKGVRTDTSLTQQQKRDKYHASIMTLLEDIKPILTPDQLAKLKENMEKHRAERQKNGN